MRCLDFGSLCESAGARELQMLLRERAYLAVVAGALQLRLDVLLSDRETGLVVVV